ncbi:Nucleolar complex protein 4 [Tetrabaena socialis]|uniref:Nucleolar complex protein 4 n=1 Tax=Tetrabaena socialis TaxID=47790 RepID=A0A2J7ZTW0_9CHLO|nr:Nucleolar complex protein 4 [Tetrabaena socialis]|eukprot:PNH03715.1 Nucleolar complex protein 4 [Tetrabaena socialis]
MAELGAVNSLVAELNSKGRAKANNVAKLLSIISTCKQEFNVVAATADKNESSRLRRKRKQAEEQQQQRQEVQQQPQQPRVQWANARTQKRLYGDAWLGLLRLPLPPDVLRKVLLRLPQSVIPHIAGPQLLADFLTHCLNRAGLTGMLALNGLFLLVTRHGLEYPQFFARLYQLLVPEAFAARSRGQFFRLADIFLSSNLVPAYTVAAFVKRFARLALTAPPAGALIAIAFIHNLIRRHPALAVLLHAPASSAAADEAEPALEAEVEGGEGEPAAGGRGRSRGGGAAGGAGAGADVYEEQELDPAKSRAVESSLWEVEALRCHYCPQVSTFVTVLDKDLTQRAKTAEVDLEDLLGGAGREAAAAGGGAGSYNSLIRGELVRKLRKMPIAFYAQPPAALFDAADAGDWGGWALGV